MGAGRERAPDPCRCAGPADSGRRARCRCSGRGGRWGLGGSRPPRRSASRPRRAVQGARRGGEAGPRLFTSGRAAASRGPAGMCGWSGRPFSRAGSPRPAPAQAPPPLKPRPLRALSRTGTQALATARGRGAPGRARRLGRLRRQGIPGPGLRGSAAASCSSAAGVGAALLRAAAGAVAGGALLGTC